MNMDEQPTDLSEDGKIIQGRLFGGPNAHLKIVESNNKETVYLFNPWEDRSVALVAKRDGAICEDLLDSLNKIKMPKEFSGIYHIDEKILEIAWTSYKLRDEDTPLKSRSFEFKLGSNAYKCRFGNSSPELLVIAKHAAYMQVSETRFRNLQSFSIYSNEDAHKDSEVSPKLGEPLSFVIEGIGDDLQEWVNVARHLNFFLKYYDHESPHIIIHDSEENSRYPTKRYIEESFPGLISSRELNTTLLSFWIASYDHDITTRFLLYYRILEYVAGSYLQAQQRQDLLKILSSPSALDALDSTLDRVAEVVRQDKLNEFDRFERMFVDLVDKKKIWNEACQNSEFFMKATEFDGGLRIEPILTDAKNGESFDSNRMKSLAASLRKIRHALAHGGEQQAGNLVLPTSKNFDLLIPWNHLAMVAAGEALLYEHLG